MAFILKLKDERLPEGCLVVVGLWLLLGRKALAVMPLYDGCFRDLKLRTPAIKAAQARPSGRVSSGSEAERGELSRCVRWTCRADVSLEKVLGKRLCELTLGSLVDVWGLAITMKTCWLSGWSQTENKRLASAELAKLAHQLAAVVRFRVTFSRYCDGKQKTLDLFNV